MSETQQNETVEVELDGQTTNRIRAHQLEDETLAETAARLLSAAPKRTTLQQGLDTEEFTDGRLILERWPDADGDLQERAYESPRQYVRRWKDATGFATTGNEQDSDGESDA